MSRERNFEMNYINLKNKKHYLTDEQAKAIEKILTENKIELSSIPVGDTFTIGDIEFVVLEQSGDTTAVITKELIKDSLKFADNSNNYNNSIVAGECDSFGEHIAGIIGEDNLIEHTVDLTSDDGLKDYGEVKKKMSLLTCELYRRYVETLDKHSVKKWWWLATAYSTPKHDNDNWVKCVSPSGYVNYSNCYDNYGVRPFLCFVSSISVSCEE